ncbi:MAG: hypothetical protein IKU07_00580 [Oscillospiraceae bacterium]|nr:hypothetical protein [Oscillospiraceae bacterium]
MRNVTTPRTVSFEDALRNLASKLTGTPVKELPRTQEAVVQYMAEHVPSVDEMAEAVTQEVIARLAQITPAGETDEEQPGGEPAADGEPASGEDGAAAASTTPEQPQEPAAEEQPATEGKAKNGKSRKN